MLLYLVVLWIKKTFYSLPKLYSKKCINTLNNCKPRVHFSLFNFQLAKNFTNVILLFCHC